MARRYKTAKVFMPSYVPRGVLQPMIESGAQIIFYKLNANMSPNIFDLSDLLAKHRAKECRSIIVSIHFCGLNPGLSRLRPIADEFNALLFSDCAHCPPMTQNSLDADVILYSVNKFLPVPDGAIMLSRMATCDVTVPDALLMPPLPPHILSYYRMHIAANIAIAKADSKASLQDFVVRSDAFYDKYYDHIDKHMSLCQQSEESWQAELITDFEQLSEERLASAFDLNETLPDPARLTHECDYTFAFPVLCNGRRGEISAQLNLIGVMPSALVARWDHCPVEYIHERRFIDDHLLLPLDGLSVEKLDQIASIFNKV